MKKFAIIAGAMAMAGALFIASPVSADGHLTMTATLNDDGSATVSGTGWQDAREDGIFLTVCRGADVTSDEPVTAGNALTACTDLMTDAFAQNPEIAEDGTWSHDLTADQVGDTPVVAIIGCLPLGCTDNSAFTVIQEAAAEEMANTGAESGLLAVIGVSVLLAGLFAVGIGRRFAKRS